MSRTYRKFKGEIYTSAKGKKYKKKKIMIDGEEADGYTEVYEDLCKEIYTDLRESLFQQSIENNSIE